MKRHFIPTTLLLGVIALAFGVMNSSSQVSAQATPDGSNATGQALEIAPPVVNLSANPGETVTAQISLRDIANGPLIVTSQINDFVAGGEDGTPKILLDEDTEPNPYSLREWIAPLSQLTLQPRQVERLPVTINVPRDAAPGGYYGVIRFTATAPEMDQTGVSLSASLGALVLLTVKGDVKESLTIEEFSAARNDTAGSLFESTPLQFVQRIKNNGNIHEQPAGQVIITDMFGKKVAGVNINLPPRNVLPGSIRKFTQTLDSSVIGNKKLFGRYQAKLTVTYGTDKKVVTSELVFWVIPYRMIGIGIALLVVAFFALRFFIQRYNRRIISKAQKRR
jgi:hypothetical protein